MSLNENERAQVLEAMGRILKSPGFKNSAQLRSFLEYITTRTLEGEHRKLKGYSIGVDALGKHESFDPTTDPSVRVSAGRLRQALTTYHLENPDDSGPVISLPKGSYVPEFVWKEEPPHVPVEMLSNPVFPTAIPTEKTYPAALLFAIAGVALFVSLLSLYVLIDRHENLVVLPDPVTVGPSNNRLPAILLEINIDTNGLPDWRTTEQIEAFTTVSITRFKEYRILLSEPGSTDLSVLDYRLNFYFSKANNPEEVYTVATVRRGNSEEVIWSKSAFFTEPKDSEDAENRQKAAAIASGVMSPYGILYGDIVNRQSPPARLDCIRNIYEYFSDETLQAYSTGLACAREAVESGNASSSMHAMLAFLNVEAYRRQFADVSDNPVRDARRLVQRAIRLDESNARAHQALFAVEKVSGNVQQALAAAKTAIERNPFDRDIIGDYAAYLVSLGRLEEAREPLKQALTLTPRPPAWLKFAQYLHADLGAEYDKADRIAESLRPDGSPLLSVAVLLSADRLGEQQRIDRAVAFLAEAEPGFLDNPKQAFIRRGYSEVLADRLSFRMAKAQFDSTIQTRSANEKD